MFLRFGCRRFTCVFMFSITIITINFCRRFSCRCFDLLPFWPGWFVAVLVVAVMTCRRYDLSPFWFVAVLTIDPKNLCQYVYTLLEDKFSFSLLLALKDLSLQLNGLNHFMPNDVTSAWRLQSGNVWKLNVFNLFCRSYNADCTGCFSPVGYTSCLVACT